MQHRILTVVPWILAASLAGAAEPAKQDPKTQSPYVKASSPKKAASVKDGTVFTNEDLEKLFGPSTEPPAESATAPDAQTAPAPAKTAPADPAARQAAIDTLEKKVNDLRTSIAALEKRAMSIRNPLLPRSEPPSEDREAWDQQNSTQRLERTEAELAAARQSLQDAEAELARLRASS